MRKNLLYFFLCLFLPLTTIGQIVITEISYNCDGYDDFEFIELYNNSGSDINLQGYYIGDGVDFQFPEYNFEANTFLVVTGDTITLKDEFGVSGLQWLAGTLSNSGEDISIYSDIDTLIDYVDYEDDSDGWTDLADGLGFTLSLCDIDADNNDPINWKATTDVSPVGIGRRQAFASPGRMTVCDTEPIIAPSFNNLDLVEGPTPDSSFLRIRLVNSNGMPSSAMLEVDPSSTATQDDYTMETDIIYFEGTKDTMLTILFTTTDDDDTPEDVKKLVLNYKIMDNVGKIMYDQITYIIYDDDITPEKSLVIAGVFSADATEFGDEFGVELYALRDIPDLSIYGVGVAGNGGGTDGVEIPLPQVALSAGESFFVADNPTRFKKFFGIDVGTTHSSIWTTGNDAVELFQNGVVIDVYGLINEDFEGTVWDYDNSWSVRESDTGPDGNTPIEENWIHVPIESLVGATNDLASFPYPLGLYTNSTGTNDLALSIEMQVYPNPVSNKLNWSADLEKTNLLRALIIDNQGRIVKSVPSIGLNNQKSIDVNNISSGLYYLTLITSKGRATTTFVKQ